ALKTVQPAAYLFCHVVRNQCIPQSELAVHTIQTTAVRCFVTFHLRMYQRCIGRVFSVQIHAAPILGGVAADYRTRKFESTIGMVKSTPGGAFAFGTIVHDGDLIQVDIAILTSKSRARRRMVVFDVGKVENHFTAFVKHSAAESSAAVA